MTFNGNRSHSLTFAHLMSNNGKKTCSARHSAVTDCECHSGLKARLSLNAISVVGQSPPPIPKKQIGRGFSSPDLFSRLGQLSPSVLVSIHSRDVERSAILVAAFGNYLEYRNLRGYIILLHSLYSMSN